MSSQLFCKVLVFISLHYYVNAYTPIYPYPYPYAQQFNYNYQPPYQQLYPQVSIPSYGQQFYPYSSNYPVYPNYPPVPQTQLFRQIPQGIPPQGGVYPAPFPYMQQSYVPTPYGNIPVEIIDVNPNQETGVIHPETSFSPGNETKTETSLAETSFTEEKKNIEIVRKPVSTSSVVQSSPQSTTITRTLDPHGGKINVIVQTNKPPLKKQDNSIEKEDGNTEDNDTTTKKYYGLFGL